MLLILPIMTGCSGIVAVDFPTAPIEGRINFTSNMGEGILHGCIHPQPEWRFAEGNGYRRVELKQSGKYSVIWPKRQFAYYILRHGFSEFSPTRCIYEGSVTVNGKKGKGLPMMGYPVCAFKEGAETYVLTVSPILNIFKPNKVVLPESGIFLCDEDGGLRSLEEDVFHDDDKSCFQKEVDFVRILKKMHFAENYQNMIVFRSVLDKYTRILYKIDGLDISQSRGAAIQKEALEYILNIYHTHPDILIANEENFTLYLGKLPHGCSYSESIGEDIDRLIRAIWEYPFLTEAQRTEYHRVFDNAGFRR